MKCSETWLREWVNPAISREDLSSSLTMAGLEVESYDPVSADLTGVVVGHVLTVTKHPDAERLQICQVSVGTETDLSIVCGANNVKSGMKTAVALPNTKLPNQLTVTAATIRGVPSQGMLCSASELGLTEQSDGIIVLPDDAATGMDLKTLLQLDDFVFDISITPNRGDCLSIKGLAREIAALTNTPLINPLNLDEPPAKITNDYPVIIAEPAACPRYIGCLIKGVKADAVTPLWIKERLRRAGIRSISLIVDVTNYVMLESGQPMHAFDAATITHGIQVRHAKQGEQILLLDGSEQTLDDQTLVIADAEKPLAIAGVMGGADSSVTLLTQTIFLESAFFNPETVARQRQYYGLQSESAYRFERGVDSSIQREAMNRAVSMILAHAGGEASAILEVASEAHLPLAKTISISVNKITEILGVAIPQDTVSNILTALAFKHDCEDDQFTIEVPPHRFDISLPEDIVEEVARLYGYDHIPTLSLSGPLQAPNTALGAPDWQPLRHLLSDLGYHEVVSYSFIDDKLQNQLDPSQQSWALTNPITSDMTVMRTNLWPGLINTFKYNSSRQQHRVHIFEVGVCFHTDGDKLIQDQRVAGLLSGHVSQEQWGASTRDVDFYDIKGHLDHIFDCYAISPRYQPEVHPALHPGQTARIYIDQQPIGWVGAVHPLLCQQLELPKSIYLFEINTNILNGLNFKQIRPISKFPEIRRDLAFLIQQTIPATAIQDTIKEIVGDWLQDIFIFDVYAGKGVPAGLKSIALALVLQHQSRTLVDEEVTDLLERVISTLKTKFGAELRR